MNKEYILDNNLEILGNKIKNFFKSGGSYVIIKNYNLLSDDELLKIYESLNKYIGKIIPIDLIKNTYEISERYWADIKYDYSSDEGQFWRSSNHQNLHTDNTFCSKDYYANLTELVCLKSAEYSGTTTIIENKKIVELIKFLDINTNSNLFDQILNREIYHSAGNNLYNHRKILEYYEEIDKYVFCYNFFPASRANNNEDDLKIINKLNFFLEEKIMHSNLMDEIKLNRGDALILNDELVMHGRKSFLGTRYYLKTGIQLDEASIFNYKLIKQEIK